MKKSRFTESQIVAILKEGEAGVAVAQITRKHGISDVLPLEIEVWRRCCVGAQAVARARGREREAEADVCRPGAGEHGDQGRSQPKTLTPSAKREAIRIMTDEHGLPIVRACQVARLSRAAFYRSGIDWAARDGEITALQAIGVKEQRWGFWKCHTRLRAQGYGWNHKRIWRVYCQLRLNLPRRTKRRVPQRERQPLLVEPRNQRRLGHRFHARYAL